MNRRPKQTSSASEGMQSVWRSARHIMSTGPGIWAPRSSLRREQNGQQSSAGLAAGGVPPGDAIVGPPALRLAQTELTVNGTRAVQWLTRPGVGGGHGTTAKLVLRTDIRIGPERQ